MGEDAEAVESGGFGTQHDGAEGHGVSADVLQDIFHFGLGEVAFGADEEGGGGGAGVFSGC